MPPCDDHYQSVPNTTTKCQKKRDRGDRTDVHFFSEDRLFVHAFHDRPGEPSVAAPPTESWSVARARRSRIYLVTVFDEAAAGALTLSPFYCLLPLSW